MTLLLNHLIISLSYLKKLFSIIKYILSKKDSSISSAKLVYVKRKEKKEEKIFYEFHFLEGLYKVVLIRLFTISSDIALFHREIKKQLVATKMMVPA